MASQSLQALRQTITVGWKNLTEEQARHHLVNTARQGIAGILNEQTATVGARPSAIVYANTPGNSNLETVKLPGPIVAIFDQRPAIVKMALEELRNASPVVSGLYRNSHIILLNGTQIDALPANLSASDQIVLTNPVPYARRIEIGKTKAGRDFTISVPNRIYERVAKNKLLPRFRNVANISFGYVELSGAYKIQGRLSSHYSIGGGKLRKRRQQVGKNVQAPAIFIRPPELRAV